MENGPDLWRACAGTNDGRANRVAGSGVRAATSPPTELPPQYSPVLAPGTTRFGMERGGSAPLAATRTPDPATLTVGHRTRRSDDRRRVKSERKRRVYAPIR